MDIRKIKKLIELLEASSLVELEIEEEEGSIRLSRAAPSIGSTITTSGIAPAIVAADIADGGADTGLPSDSSQSELPPGHIVRSPMVGSYYAAPKPEDEPFAKVGNHVNVGDTLCILEAMKIFNRIEADHAGVIRAVFKENGDPVEYGENLFVIE